jgi:glycine cleavage system H protein
MLYPDNYYFTIEREWVNFLDDHTALVGLTELAIRELQPITNMEIHTVGQSLLRTQVFGRVKNDRLLCKLVMPFDGVVLEANDTYINNLETINGAYAYENWIVKVKLTKPIDKSGLFTLDQYKVQKTNSMFRLITYLLPMEKNGKEES